MCTFEHSVEHVNGTADGNQQEADVQAHTPPAETQQEQLQQDTVPSNEQNEEGEENANQEECEQQAQQPDAGKGCYRYRLQSSWTDAQLAQ